MPRYRHPEPLGRPLEELGGALEAALVERGAVWRIHKLEREEGWFDLERKRFLRANVSCRLTLVSSGDLRTALEVEAATVALAEAMVGELLALVESGG